MAQHNNLGKWGEQIAADRYISDGFHIYARNWREGPYEIDIVAIRDGLVAVAEVKTRSDMESDPLEAINRRKIMHMVRSAEYFLAKYPDLPYNVRFDLFAIRGTPDEYHMEFIEDAFYPPLKSYR